jgi:hypothetical protein
MFPLHPIPPKSGDPWPIGRINPSYQSIQVIDNCAIEQHSISGLRISTRLRIATATGMLGSTGKLGRVVDRSDDKATYSCGKERSSAPPEPIQNKERGSDPDHSHEPKEKFAALLAFHRLQMIVHLHKSRTTMCKWANGKRESDDKFSHQNIHFKPITILFDF